MHIFGSGMTRPHCRCHSTKLSILIEALFPDSDLPFPIAHHAVGRASRLWQDGRPQEGRSPIERQRWQQQPQSQAASTAATMAVAT